MIPSYVQGASTTSLLGETIGASLDRATRRVGEQDALISCHQGLRYTYLELYEEVTKHRFREPSAERRELVLNAGRHLSR